MSHKYFTINERNKLEVLLKENYRVSEIAEILNRHRATIYREIKRIKGGYSSEEMLSWMPILKPIIKEGIPKLLLN